MKRHLNWMNKPITWGALMKLSGICTLVGTAIGAVELVMLMESAWWKATKDFVRRVFDK